MSKCIIVGAGNIELEQLKRDEGDFVIAADGGFPMLMTYGILPDLLIGDMDSIGNQDYLSQADQCHIPVVRLPVMKDDTDMLAAIREGLHRGFCQFALFGALGGRLDHTIANLQCLQFLIEHGARGEIIENHTRTFLIKNDKITFPPDAKGTISVFSFGEDAKGVTEKGLKYEVEKVTLTSGFPIGVSNEFVGKESCISVEKGTLLIHVIYE